MTALQERPAVAQPAPGSPLAGRAGLVLVWVALATCLAGLVAGLFSGPLWLDEALSVEIASLPLPEMISALRRDGSPPLYYLLLQAWMATFGTGTVAVRLLTTLMVPLALLLAHRLGHRLGGLAGARATVVVLAVLPWTMRFGSEARMYLLVVVLVLAGALALLQVREAPSRGAQAGLAAASGALLLTHYWSLFLLAAVALLHLPGLWRREGPALRVAAAGALGGVLFLPWLPSFLFQVTYTGAPWAVPPGALELLRTPRYWGSGDVDERTLLTALIIPLAVAAGVRAPASWRVRPMLGVLGLTLVLAWLQTALMGGAYTGRYTAVVVPLVAAVIGFGAVSLPGRRWPVLALALVVAVGAVSGVRGAAIPRTSADEVAEAFTAAASEGDFLLYCPDQLGPPTARLIGPGYRQVVYPELDRPELIDWVGYTARNDAAEPAQVAQRVHAVAAGRTVFVLKAAGYRTFESDCNDVLVELQRLRDVPERVYGETTGVNAQQLYRFDPA